MTNLSRKQFFMQMLVVVCCTIVLGLTSLLYPFGADQGSFSYMSSELLDGERLYEDVFNIKPPLTYYLVAMALATFGHTMMSIRLLDLLWQTGMVILIVAIASYLYQQRFLGLLGAIFYAISYYGRDFWNIAQTDGFLSLPVALGVLAFLVARDRQANWWFFLCGFALGIATLFKYPIGIMLPLLALLTLFYPKPKIWHRLIPGLFIGLGSIVAVLLLFAILALRGELDGFLFMNFGYLPFYVQQTNTPLDLLVLTVQGVLKFLFLSSILMGLSSIVLVLELVLAIRSKRLLDIAPLLVWWVGGLVHLAAQMKFFGYHSLPVLVPQSILLARGFFILYEWVKPWKVARIGLSTLLVLFLIGLFVGYDYPQRYQTLWRVVSGKQTLRSAYERVDDDPETFTTIRPNLQVVDYVRAHTEPSDMIFVWGFEPMIYFLAERECASRYVYNHPLFVDIPNLSMRQEFVDELKSNQPVYILIAQDDTNFLATGQRYDSQEAFERFDTFYNFVQAEYTQEKAMDYFVLYRRNE